MIFFEISILKLFSPNYAVSCGKQNGSWSEANSCEECPQGNGASWCGGSCQWTDEKCIDKESE